MIPSFLQNIIFTLSLLDLSETNIYIKQFMILMESAEGENLNPQFSEWHSNSIDCNHLLKTNTI